MDCVFCKIVSGELPVNKEFEDDDIVVFKSNRPETPVHLLVVPKRHIESLKVAEDDDVQVLGKIQLMAKRMAEKFEIVGGYKVMVNAGKFQEVPHIHYHLKGGMN
ncbi:HIT domain-containing protein [Candidatus Amesbacteria bacterium]|nr:HIT domain-containing protein [Candidatus Amesbacteria bacterium]